MKQETSIPDPLKSALAGRKAVGNLRRLSAVSGLADFSSNDFLGFARSAELQARLLAALEELWAGSNGMPLIGATGSRLLTGNSTRAEELEQQIAAFHGAEAALLFSSGYAANLGLLSSVGRRGDTILYDERAHASIKDGARLGQAGSFSFRHNDPADLERRIRGAAGSVYVAVESLYSMHGDPAPLFDLTEVCSRSGAYMIVDEAHATGVFGPDGRGLVAGHGLEAQVFARIYTFGKALGLHGAAVLGSAGLRDFLINFARPFVYSTGLPLTSLTSIRLAYGMLQEAGSLRDALWRNIGLFRSGFRGNGLGGAMNGDSPIQWIGCSGSGACRRLAAAGVAAGLDLRPILSPTVPKGQEGIRVCLHAFNTEEEVRAVGEVVSG